MGAIELQSAEEKEKSGEKHRTARDFKQISSGFHQNSIEIA